MASLNNSEKADNLEDLQAEWAQEDDEDKFYRDNWGGLRDELLGDDSFLNGTNKAALDQILNEVVLTHAQKYQFLFEVNTSRHDKINKKIPLSHALSKSARYLNGPKRELIDAIIKQHKSGGFFFASSTPLKSMIAAGSSPIKFSYSIFPILIGTAHLMKRLFFNTWPFFVSVPPRSLILFI